MAAYSSQKALQRERWKGTGERGHLNRISSGKGGPRGLRKYPSQLPSKGLQLWASFIRNACSFPFPYSLVFFLPGGSILCSFQGMNSAPLQTTADTPIILLSFCLQVRPKTVCRDQNLFSLREMIKVRLSFPHKYYHKTQKHCPNLYRLLVREQVIHPSPFRRPPDYAWDYNLLQMRGLQVLRFCSCSPPIAISAFFLPSRICIRLSMRHGEQVPGSSSLCF